MYIIFLVDVSPRNIYYLFNIYRISSNRGRRSQIAYRLGLYSLIRAGACIRGNTVLPANIKCVFVARLFLLTLDLHTVSHVLNAD